MSKLRILLADDHEIFRAGLKALVDAQPDLQVIGEAASGEEAVAKATALEPDLVLMDIAMPGISGIEATRRIRSARPRIQVLALTAHDSPEYFFTMLQAEAAGYVLKEASPGELFAAIRAAQRVNPIDNAPYPGNATTGYELSADSFTEVAPAFDVAALVIAYGPREITSEFLANLGKLVDLLLDVLQVVGERQAGAHAEEGGSA